MILEALLWIKAGGSMLGSSIAVVFTSTGDHPLVLLKRFVLGTIMGFISSPIIIDTLKWDHSFDYWLASATLGGLLGYLFLQMLFSNETIERFRSLIRGKK